MTESPATAAVAQSSAGTDVNAASLVPKTGLLTPYEVGVLFEVDPKTVTRWAKAGKLPYQMTLGGHRRYPAEQIHALVDSLKSENRQGDPDGEV